MYHKDSIMDPRKIDWLLLNKRTELRKIMRDNGKHSYSYNIPKELKIKFPTLGSYFIFPALGSGSNSLSIYAENRINVERSVRLLNYLVRLIHLNICSFFFNILYSFIM